MNTVSGPRSIVSLLAVAAAAVALVPAIPAGAQPGQKLDSGLGELPHYRHWVDPTGRAPMGSAIVGEKQDNGLGELPHYRHWKDKTGRDPMGRDAVQLASGVGR